MKIVVVDDERSITNSLIKFFSMTATKHAEPTRRKKLES
jgi:hypothetical protein